MNGVYQKVTEQDLEILSSFGEEGQLLVGEEISVDYHHDELSGICCAPEVLIKVKNTEQISAIMRYANERRIPVTVRGSGTGLVGAAVPVRGGILLETTAMNQILKLDGENFTVTVQPGVLLMELLDFTSKHGFLYPPDPGEKSATIGGNISTNAGGMRAVKYGVTRDYVRELTVVLPDGEILRLGGPVVKDSSGYGLKDLVIGSEGTLCIITEAVLKLLPLPVCSISLLVPFKSLEGALGLVPEIIKGSAVPTAVEYVSRECVRFSEDYLGKKFPDSKSGHWLLLTYDGNNREQVEQGYRAAADLCLENGASDVYLVDTEERKHAVWSARGAFLEAIKASTTEMDECDVVVPRTRAADFIVFTQELAEELGIRIPVFGHAGDGNLHVYLCRDGLTEDEWGRKKSAGFERMYQRARELDGLVSGEHGIGYAKKEYLKDQYGESHIALMNRVKMAFDPKNILNPGKVCQL